MGRLKGQFQALLGQTIASLARVALTQDNKLSPLMDTLEIPDTAVSLVGS